MQPDERDAGYLWDMLDAAKAVEEFTEGYLIISISRTKRCG